MVKPAVVAHPSEFIREEMRARGWNLTAFLGYSGAASPEDELGWRLYFRIGKDFPDMRMGERGAQQLARAFGTSAELWLHLEKAWMEARHES